MSGDPVNRVTLLTPAGVSALACVRLDGPAVGSFLDRRFSRPTAPGRAVHGELRDEAGVIDDPVVTRSADGISADLCVHGGAWIVRATIELARAEGFEWCDAEPTPDDVASEAAAWLGQTRTDASLRLLLHQPAAWRAWMSEDRSEDDLRAVSNDRTLFHLLMPPRVAIVGPPNAGKSTLTNLLCRTRRSITSAIAGTTRDYVCHEADLDGLIVELIDTPGRRQTDDAIEAQAIDLARPTVERATVRIVLLDGSVAPVNPHDFADDPSCVWVNKSDRLHEGWSAALPEARRLCATDESSRPDIGREIHEMLGVNFTPRPLAWLPSHFDRLSRGDVDATRRWAGSAADRT
jgi:small GTP-binding protein